MVLRMKTMTMWTDNGAALNGMDWHTGAAPPVPTLNGSIYIQLNWSMVDESKMGAVIDSIAASGVTPRAAQIDCWWYPTTHEHTDYCGLDWVLPTEFFPNGMAGVHSRLNVRYLLPNLLLSPLSHAPPTYRPIILTSVPSTTCSPHSAITHAYKSVRAHRFLAPINHSLASGGPRPPRPPPFALILWFWQVARAVCSTSGSA